jgi:cell division transport system ATP-binding protein
MTVPVVGVGFTPRRLAPPGRAPATEPNVTVAPDRFAAACAAGPSIREPLSPPPARSLLDRLPALVNSRGAGRDRLQMNLAHADRAVVVLHDVTKTYPNGKVALREVDLIVPEGDFVFLVGPSGAGKSTLIKLLIGDELASRGEVVLDGEDLARLSRRQIPRVRRKIGIVFQDFKLLPSKTVRENVAFALEVTGTSRRRIGPEVDRVLALVGLTAQSRQVPAQLSGGEQQRTAIARALVHDPRIIIADEPTGNLDPLISWEIIQLLLRINELGVTVFMATHNAEVVTALRKRVVALEDGRIIRDEVGGAYHRED